MSFWSHSPGPFWSHFFQSLFVCKDPDIGLLNPFLDKLERVIPVPSGTRTQELTELNATQIEQLLHKHYQTFPRSKLVLSEKRIREGFLYDGWIGVGVYSGLKLIGCVISRDLGRLQVIDNNIPKTGLIDFFCVDSMWRKKGIASLLLQEIVILTGKRKRLVHVFQKEGFPLSPLPPVWQSHYIWRKKGPSLPTDTDLEAEDQGSIGKEGIETRTPIRSFNYASTISLRSGSNRSISSIPNQLSGDSELYSFNYKGHSITLCVTDTYHRSVPEGWRIGEISWILPHGFDPVPVPVPIQALAIETLVDTCGFEVLLMDAHLPHQKDKGWEKDSPYGYYLFNYNPGHFFSLKPYFVL